MADKHACFTQAACDCALFKVYDSMFCYMTAHWHPTCWSGNPANRVAVVGEPRAAMPLPRPVTLQNPGGYPPQQAPSYPPHPVHSAAPGPRPQGNAFGHSNRSFATAKYWKALFPGSSAMRGGVNSTFVVLPVLEKGVSKQQCCLAANMTPVIVTVCSTAVEGCSNVMLALSSCWASLCSDAAVLYYYNASILLAHVAAGLHCCCAVTLLLRCCCCAAAAAAVALLLCCGAAGNLTAVQ